MNEYKDQSTWWRLSFRTLSGKLVVRDYGTREAAYRAAEGKRRASVVRTSGLA